LNEKVAYKAKTAVANLQLKLVPVGDTATNFKTLIKVSFGGVAQVNVALQDGSWGNVWPISVPDFRFSRLSVTFGRSLISGNEKSVERTVQVDVERGRDAEIFDGQLKCKFRSIASHLDWCKNLWITINRQPRSIAAHKGFTGSICTASRSIGSFLVSTVHLDCVPSVDCKQNNSSQFHERLRLIPPILFCLASNLAMCLGWLKIRFWCKSRRDWYLGMAGLFLGFPSSVYSLIVLTDRLGM